MSIKNDVALLHRAIEQKLPQPWSEWPGGYPDEIEAALLDAVLSVRAAYGKPHNGVRGATSRYRARVGKGCDDLTRLARHDPHELSRILENNQKASGRSKSELIVQAASNLVAAGVHRAADLDVDEHRRAYTSVHGLGKVTWEYFTMLLGNLGSRPTLGSLGGSPSKSVAPSPLTKQQLWSERLQVDSMMPPTPRARS